MYKCPVCNKGLKKEGKTFVCEQRHSYDISKEGYVNLLLANQKNSKDPGDSKEMIQNRTNFLEQGFYDPLAKKLNETIAEAVSKIPGANILDLGCGEGFYTQKLEQYLTKNKNEFQLWGVDISKSAIQKAAKRDPHIYFCIGSNFQLPYCNRSFDLIFSIFAPLDPQEIARILKPNGKIIVVRPGPTHLQELAELIYEKAELQGNSSNLSENLNMPELKTMNITDKIHLKNQENIQNLIGMTPYFFRLSEEKKLRIKEKKELITTIDFQLSIFQKSS